MKHQKITNILKSAGFVSSKVKWENGKRITTSGYRVRQFGKEIGIDCCFYQSEVENIIAVLNNAGFEAFEKFSGGAMIQVN